MLGALRELSLFAGGGGGLLGSGLLGHVPVCAVEHDPFCRSVLFARQRDRVLPPFPVWDDIETFSGLLWRGKVDLVSAGFPCQGFSTASRGRRVQKNLWPEALRVIQECAAPVVFAENVQRDPIQRAAADLARIDYVVRCARVPASSVGAPHRRERFWLLAYAHVWGEPAEPIDAEVAGLPAAGGAGPASHWWTDAPDQVLEVADGLPGGLERSERDRAARLSVLGNAQVPAAVVYAWKFLSRAHP